jgi:hypothetical protein
VYLSLAVLVLQIDCVFPAEDIKPATDALKPFTPEESRRSFQVPQGCSVELVAAESLIAEPTEMHF